MANTYTLIASNTLGASAASVTFSAIPATYTDLVLRFSARSTNADYFDNVTLELNTDTGTNYSRTTIQGNGASAVSPRVTSGANWNAAIINGNTSTADSFGSAEIYLPSYTSTSNKPASFFGVNETNSTTAVLRANAYLYQNAVAITEIKLQVANLFVAGSSFFLYGISSS